MRKYFYFFIIGCFAILLFWAVIKFCKHSDFSQKEIENEFYFSFDTSFEQIFSKYDSSNVIIIISDIKNKKIFSNNRKLISDPVFHPGSIQKIITTYSLLDDTTIFSYRFFCSGKSYFNKIKFQCWNREGHGLQNLKMAFANSCNLFYFSLFNIMDFEKLFEQTELFYSYEILKNISESKNDIVYPVSLKNKFEFLIGDNHNLKISLLNLNSLMIFLCGHKNDDKIKTILKFMRYTVHEGTAKNSFYYDANLFGKTGTVYDEHIKYGIFTGIFSKKDDIRYYGIVVCAFNRKSDFASSVANEIIRFLAKK